MSTFYMIKISEDKGARLL